MSDLSQSIHRILGIKLDPRRATLYDILGLQAFEQDPSKIKQAVIQAIHKIKAFDPASDPQGAQQVASLVDRARKQLLDPTTKTAYDRKLQGATSASASASAANSAAKSKTADDPDSNLDEELDGWFPSADPRAPFDLGQYITRMSQSQPNIVSVEAVEVEAVELEAVELEAAGPMNVALLEPPLLDTSPTVSTTNANRPLLPISANLSKAPVRKTIRRRKDRTIWLYMGGFIAGSLVVLGVGAYLLNQSQDVDKQIASNEPPPPVIRIPNKASTDANAVNPSTKPKEPGIAADMDKFKLGSKPVTSDEGNNSAAIVPMEPAVTLPNSEADSSSPMASDVNDTATAMTENVPVEESSAEEPNQDTAEAMETTEENSPIAEDGPLGQEDRKALVAAMKSARKAIAEWDFQAFNEQIEIALPLAREAPYTDQFARLDQLGQLQRIAVEGLRTAVAKLTSGETFKVMRNEVAFVEGSDDHIVVRVAGKNERHVLKSLPLGLALGLFDLSLDKEAAQDVAARGVYLSLHPKANKAMKQRGEEMLKKASESDTIRPDLLEALRDKYE